MCSAIFLWVGPFWRAHIGRGEKSRGGGLRSGSPASGPRPAPAAGCCDFSPPTRPRPPSALLPYKAALPPRDVGVSSHPLYRWRTEVPEVQRLAPGQKLGRKQGQHPTPSTPTSHNRKRRLAQTQRVRVRQNRIQPGFSDPYPFIHPKIQSTCFVPGIESVLGNTVVSAR